MCVAWPWWTAGLAALVLPLVESTALHWPAWTWVSLALSPALFALFVGGQVRSARRGGTPLLDPELFRRRALAAGLVTQLAFWCGQASFFLVLALYLQQGRSLDALHAGLSFSILAVAYLAASLRAPALTPRLGRDLIAAGALAPARRTRRIRGQPVGVSPGTPHFRIAISVPAGVPLVVEFRQGGCQSWPGPRPGPSARFAPP
jgi:hypothetical protein